MPHVAANKGVPFHYRNGKQNTYTSPMGVLKAYEVLTTRLGLSPGEVQTLTDQGVLYQSEVARQRRLAPSARE